MAGYDAIVIGAGHNRLTAAGHFAKAGWKVLVVESRDIVGGIAAGEEFHPGYRTTGLLHDTTCVWADVIKSLSLTKYGLQLRAMPAPIFVPSENSGLLLHRDSARAHDEQQHHPAETLEIPLASKGWFGGHRAVRGLRRSRLAA